MLQPVSENDVIAAIQKNTNCSIFEAAAQISTASLSRLVEWCLYLVRFLEKVELTMLIIGVLRI